MENHDHSVKDEELHNVSGGAHMGEIEMLYVPCRACGAYLSRTPADDICPYCGSDYRKPHKPVKHY